VAGCSQEQREPRDDDPVAVQRQQAIAQGHMRVLVRYEAGQFATERVKWVGKSLKQPRSNRPRPGLRFVARAAGHESFQGYTADPRTVHVEVPGANGKLEHHEVTAPVARYFWITVPAQAETVDFQPPVMGRHAAATAAAGAGAPAVLGTIDLRSHK